MAAATDYLSAIRARIPRIKADDELNRELERRAAEGQSVDRVVADAYGFDKVREGEEEAAAAAANAQVDPGLRAQETELANERSEAEKNASRLQQQIAEVYQRRRANDPLARMGIVSSAAQGFQVGEEAKQVREVGTDLNDRLSYIARRLSDSRSSAATQKAGLVSGLRDQYLKERQAGERQYLSDQQTTEDRRYALEDRATGNALQAANLYQQFLTADAPVPREVYDLIRRLSA